MKHSQSAAENTEGPTVRTSVKMPVKLIERATKLRVRGAKIVPLATVLRSAVEQGLVILEGGALASPTVRT